LITKHALLGTYACCAEAATPCDGVPQAGLFSLCESAQDVACDAGVKPLLLLMVTRHANIMAGTVVVRFVC
jgi:hypothetical protein